MPGSLHVFAAPTSSWPPRLVYSGELGTDLGPLGRWWGDRVTPVWEAAVARTFRSGTAEAERRAAAHG